MTTNRIHQVIAVGPVLTVGPAATSGCASARASGEGPDWSPDGQRIAFVCERDGNPEIYVMNTDGSGQRNLTRGRADETGFAWSPVRTKSAGDPQELT